MTSDANLARIATFEQLIRQVRGIQGARVVLGADDDIDEIHVLGSPDRAPKAVIRDIETILLVQGGIRVNHRKISLAQVADTVVPQTRVQLFSVDAQVDSGQVQVTVVLTIGRRRVDGIASGVDDSAAGRDILVGQAMMAALRQLVDPEVSLHVAYIGRSSLGDIEACLAHVELQTVGRFETMLGISAVRGDPLQAMARALLDAMNRRLPGLMGAA